MGRNVFKGIHVSKWVQISQNRTKLAIFLNLQKKMYSSGELVKTIVDIGLKKVSNWRKVGLVFQTSQN